LGREYFAKTKIDIFKKTLSGCLQKKDLVVMIFMVGEITAFFTHELFVHHAIGNEALHVIWTLIVSILDTLSC
jgi:hypothetical protein